MDKRLLAKREQLRENMQTSIPKLLTILSIPELRKRMEAPGRGRTKEIYQTGWEDWQELQAREYWINIKQSKKNNFDDYIKACGVPKVFRYGGIQPINEIRSLFMTGGFGTGKTYKSVEILKGFVKKLHCGHFLRPYKNTPIFITVPELLLKIRSCFNSQDVSEESMLKDYFNTPLLILDDLGAEKTTDWALQSLYIIVNKRLSEEKQTIITSNLSLDELKEKLGDRIASRIAGMCKVMQLKGKDRRFKSI